MKMYCRLLAVLFALVALSLAVEHRKPHRTIENRLRIVNPDPNDAEPLRIEASGGGKKKGKPDKDEKPKTLSQQIVDGKYGLIQKELFAKPPKRPGIISYENNPEVPNDNVDNLGGLDKNEIWLAENHLLVLRGGKFPPYDDRKPIADVPWPPLDNYKAPLHQVKIPKHPKVPPPFPVQLTENGPLQILGTNSSRTLNETDKAYAYPVPPPEGYDPSSFYPYDTNSSDASPWSAPMQVPFHPSGEYAPGEPFPPHLLNGSLPPSLGYLPPGAVVLPPPGNLTDELYDYDDPSIYYPPPYSFFYPKDNFSAVPAGPLVPGIVLPPPPNFFAALEETTTAEPVTTVRKPMRQRKPTTTPLPTTTKPTEGTTRKAVRIYPTSNYYSNEIKPTVTTTTPAPRPTTVPPTRPDNRFLPVVTRKPTVTKLRPINPPKTYSNKPFLQYGPPVPGRSPYVTTTQVPLEYHTTPNDVKQYDPPAPSRAPFVTTTQVPLEYHTTSNEIRQYGSPGQSRTPFVTTTQVPLKYHTTSNDIETNSVTQEADRYVGTRRGKSTKPRPTPTQYFYYEETEKAAPPATRRPTRPIYLDSTEEYYQRPKPIPTTTRQRKPQYVYVTARPYNTQKPRFRFIQQPVKSDTFDVHIAKLQKQIQQQYYTAPRTTYRPAPKPVYQFSFQAENYPTQQGRFKPSPQELPQQDQFRPGPPKYSVEIQQAIEVTPTYDNRRPTYDDRRPTYNDRRPTYDDRRPTYDDRRPTYDDRRPTYDNRRPIFYQQEYRTSTEPPRSQYTTPRPDYDYETVTQKAKYVTTPRPISEYSFEVTQNPVFRGFYTQPDEGYFDDRTKKYFTMFGRKLPSTTPVPALDQVTPIDSYSYRQKPVSLEGDTLVNYVNPRPTINPDAEIIPVHNPPPPRYPNVVKYPSRPEEVAPNPEIIKAIPIDVESGKTEDGSFISYQLPGDDGAHFYFLTPQLAQSRDQGAGFYYSRPQRSRIRRNEKTIDKER